MSTKYSYAKINLGLSVGPRVPPKNFHNIESIMIRINFADEITISKAEKFTLKSTNNLKFGFEDFEHVSERGSNFEDNLMFKTYKLVEKYLQFTPGMHVNIIKNIPTGGGLGGGSSNAAMLLSWFKKVYAIENEKINAFIDGLGSDVKFFLKNKHQFLSGTGALLKNIQVKKMYGVLAIPPIRISTKWAYDELKRPLQQSLDENVLFRRQDLTDFDFFKKNSNTLNNVANGHWHKLSISNDFEEVVFKHHPFLKDIKRQFLISGALYCAMSGSGSTIYGLVTSKIEAKKLINKLRVNNVFVDKATQLVLFQSI